MTSVLSNSNNTNTPLLSYGIFEGNFELVNAYTSASIGIYSYSNCQVEIIQSIDTKKSGKNYTTKTFNILANKFINLQTSLSYPYCYIKITNIEPIDQLILLVSTRWLSVDVINAYENIISSYNSQIQGYGWISNPLFIGVCPLIDIYMKGINITSLLGMNFIVQTSPDGIDLWINSNSSIKLTSSNLQGGIIAFTTASPYIRLIADPSNDVNDVISNIQIVIPIKTT